MPYFSFSYDGNFSACNLQNVNRYVFLYKVLNLVLLAAITGFSVGKYLRKRIGFIPHQLNKCFSMKKMSKEKILMSGKDFG